VLIYLVQNRVRATPHATVDESHTYKYNIHLFLDDMYFAVTL
jgi:hypothetical protein